jgi:hypothetical protein
MPLSEIMNFWDERLENQGEGVPPAVDPDGSNIWDKSLGVQDNDRPPYGDTKEASVDGSGSQDSNGEVEDRHANTKPESSQLAAYRDFIFSSPAYVWLLASLQKEFILDPAEPNAMESIRRKILNFLPTSHKISRKKSAEVYKTTFRIVWDPLAFVKEQEYREEPGTVVETAITVTGSAKDAQALTCTQYLCQTWPSTGEHTIRLIKHVVSSGPGHRHACKFLGLEWGGCLSNFNVRSRQSTR